MLNVSAAETDGIYHWDPIEISLDLNGFVLPHDDSLSFPRLDKLVDETGAARRGDQGAEDVATAVLHRSLLRNGGAFIDEYTEASAGVLPLPPRAPTAAAGRVLASLAAAGVSALL